MSGTAEEQALLEMWRAEILAAGGRIPRGDDDDSEDDFEDDDTEDDFEDEDLDDEPDPDEVARAAERVATFAAARDMAGPNASTSTVNRAAAIVRYGCPEVVAAVRSGAIAVKLASEIVRLPAAEQPGALAAELAKRTAKLEKRTATAQRIAKRKAHREARWAAKRGEREARAARARELQARRDEKSEREYAARIAARLAPGKENAEISAFSQDKAAAPAKGSGPIGLLSQDKAAAPGKEGASQDAPSQDKAAADEPSEDLLEDRLSHRERVARGEA